MHRGVLAVPVVLAALGLAGCGDDPVRDPGATPASTGGSSASTPLPDGPACEEVWADGQDLPQSYRGCVDGSTWVAADTRRCESGQVLVVYADQFYGAKGAVVNDMGGPLEESRQFQRASRSCG